MQEMIRKTDKKSRNVRNQTLNWKKN